jgi:hypothetical protein
MASLNMLGPYSLTEDEIDKRIRSGVSGNYAYGHQDKKGTFIVQYVGRSDTDLNSRIKHGIGKYNMFKFSYASSAKEAFERECKNYHDFGGDRLLDNEMHPDRPKNTDYECPICTIFDD